MNCVLVKEGVPVQDDPSAPLPDNASTPEQAQDAGELLERFLQTEETGGIHTPPEVRLLLFAIGVALRAEFVVELGYDAGYTLEALALTGADAVGVDDLSEYSVADTTARERLSKYNNVTLLKKEAIAFMQGLEDGSVDLMFIDDSHAADHVKLEVVEVKRVIRPGGVAVFHDTVVFAHLAEIVRDAFSDWERLTLPAISMHANKDFGITIVRKPN
jgi:predicted O-methyltransferase YrrM